MRNISYKTATIFNTTGGNVCPRCQEYSYSTPVGSNYLDGGLDSVGAVRSFIWDNILPSMAKKMEVRLGYVREYVLSLSDPLIVSEGLSPAEQRVVGDLLKFGAHITHWGMRSPGHKGFHKSRQVAFVYVNNNTLRSLVWTHHVRSFRA